jgi:hypothetical protein
MEVVVLIQQLQVFLDFIDADTSGVWVVLHIFSKRLLLR